MTNAIGKRRYYFYYFLLCLNLEIGHTSLAVPIYYINHDKKMCGEFIPGDECSQSSPSRQWTELSGPCPKSYQNNIKIPAFQKEYYKNEFCCTSGHSGSAGNCVDLVINKSEKKCAFVRKIENCKKIPILWSKPETEDRLCPSNYSWNKELLDC